MECLQFFSRQTASYLCQSSFHPVTLSALLTPNLYWAIAALASLGLLVILWYDRSKTPLGFFPSPLLSLSGSYQWGRQSPATRAERLLREGMTQQEYELLLYFGYLEIPSRLYPTLFYRILRKRRVHVYDLCDIGLGQRYQKLGELGAVAHEPMADADIFLLHKWLIEVDEQAYLDNANWVGHSTQTRLYHASGSYAIHHILGSST